MEFRILTADDAGAYWTLRLEALEGDPDAFSSSADEHRMLTIEDIAKRLHPADPVNNFVVGAFSGDRLMGTAGFYRDKGLKELHKGHVWGVYLTREARGRGVGGEMMRVLLERARQLQGVEQIKVSVTASQVAALKLYRSLGFESYGYEPRALKIGNRYIDEHHMALIVHAPKGC